jgi:hypothetical protein
VGSFNTIPHDLVVKLLKKKIEDKRFLCLIQAMLDAGYLEDWRYHATYSGVPASVQSVLPSSPTYSYMN